MKDPMDRQEREKLRSRKRRRMSLGYSVRLLSWFMVIVAIVTVIMTFLSTFYIWVTDTFNSAQTLLWVLLFTFGIWSLRNFLDSRIYPIYKIQGFLFLILTVVAGYLLTTPVF